MAKREQYTCDVCGTEKKAANHWWKIRMWRDEIRMVPWERSNATSRDEIEFHLCGQACVITKVNEFMNTPTEKTA